jgi:hypothetical protein
MHLKDSDKQKLVLQQIFDHPPTLWVKFLKLPRNYKEMPAFANLFKLILKEMVLYLRLRCISKILFYKNQFCSKDLMTHSLCG